MERDPLLRSTIVAVALFDRAPEWDELARRMDRASRLVPTFRKKLLRHAAAPGSVPLGGRP